MTPRKKQTKIKRLKWQLNKTVHNDVLSLNILKKNRNS